MGHPRMSCGDLPQPPDKLPRIEGFEEQAVSRHSVTPGRPVLVHRCDHHLCGRSGLRHRRLEGGVRRCGPLVNQLRIIMGPWASGHDERSVPLRPNRLGHPVADLSLRVNESRISSVVIELAPQVADKRSDQLGLSRVLRGPYPVEKLIVGQDETRLGGQLIQELVLRRRPGGRGQKLRGLP